ncbi:hypothetical protein F5883DRAFT_27748 [Diaporthe sp. PMI_573]|nr:hypothetical protein F5883DRAFT_27748 [Diaporthaceae sp. PMI_573]
MSDQYPRSRGAGAERSWVAYSEDEHQSAHSENAEICDQAPYYEGQSSLAGHVGRQVPGHHGMVQPVFGAGNQPTHPEGTRTSYSLPSIHELSANGQLPPNTGFQPPVGPSRRFRHQLALPADIITSNLGPPYHGHGSFSTEGGDGQPPHDFAAEVHPSFGAGAGNANQSLHASMLPPSNIDPRSDYTHGYPSQPPGNQNDGARNPFSSNPLPAQVVKQKMAGRTSKSAILTSALLATFSGFELRFVMSKIFD